VTAKAIKGPYVGLPAVTYKYIALPVTHHIVLLVWLEPKFKHNTFVYNLKNHISSVVTWDQKGDPSLGSVTIIRAGSHPIVATRRQAPDLRPLTREGWCRRVLQQCRLGATSGHRGVALGCYVVSRGRPKPASILSMSGCQ
jgi:hypothetical protein